MPKHTGESWREAGLTGKRVLPHFQKEVEAMVADGKSNQEIAKEFGVDRSAVSRFLKKLREKDGKPAKRPRKFKPRPETVDNPGIKGNEKAIKRDFNAGMSRIDLAHKYGTSYRQMEYYIAKRQNRIDSVYREDWK